MTDCKEDSQLMCILKIILCCIGALLALALVAMGLGAFATIIEKILSSFLDKVIASFIANMIFALLYLWQFLEIGFDFLNNISALTRRSKPA